MSRAQADPSCRQLLLGSKQTQHLQPLPALCGLRAAARAEGSCSFQTCCAPLGPCLQLRKETYSRLTPTQRLQVARHPNRPTCLDIILNISGDREAALAPAAARKQAGLHTASSTALAAQQRGGISRGCLVEMLPGSGGTGQTKKAASWTRSVQQGRASEMCTRVGEARPLPSLCAVACPVILLPLLLLPLLLLLTDKFVELHGDRAGLDDPAIVCGIGSIDGKSFMFIGHQKGRNTKVSSSRSCDCSVACPFPACSKLPSHHSCSASGIK